MKISYKILWIDDQLDHIEEDRMGVEEFLEKFGILADISIITNSIDQSISDLTREHISNNPELDILLVDYHMPDLKGDELVSQIRNTDHVYLPVIFYSARGIEEILQAAYEARLDGVYFTDRLYLIRKFQEVALSLLNREHTPKRIRGLLMEEVSEIDAKFKDIYDHVWEKLPENSKQNLVRYLKNIIAERAKNANNTLDNFPAHPRDFSHHMGDKFLSPSYDTHTRCRVVCKMLEYLGYDRDNREVLKEFHFHQGEDSLLELRNRYAHRTRQELQENHSVDECIKVRQEIRRQQDNIDRIVDSVSSSQ